MRRIHLVLFLILGCQLSIVNYSLYAATKPVKVKTLLSDARAAVKNRSNQANAEKKLLENITREDVKREQQADMYFMAQELERSLNDAENMKFYLKQPYDTVKFFSTILLMHEYLLLCDSVESLPNSKGELKIRYRNRGREILKAYRPNLLNGGKFLLKRNKYAEAYPYFDMYLRMRQTPFFEGLPDIQNDSILPRVAYWATISAYDANNPKKALAYIDEAIASADSALRVSLQEYKVRCHEALGNRDAWVDNLVMGVRQHPAHDYFFLHLMDLYADRKAYDDALNLCDSMLHVVGDRAIYWYGKSRMFLAKEEYDSCIVVSDQALRLDSQMVDAYYNKGIACLNKAVLFAETACNDIRNPKCWQDRQTLQALYRDALLPMEQVRRMEPENTKRWASPLYRIYLYLNMGSEFAEMEKILNAQ